MTTREIGVALVGYGAIGRLHALCYSMLPLVAPGLSVRLVGVATRSAENQARARRELGEIVATARLADLLALPEVTMVDVCTPTSAHTAAALEALEAGKALLCEKPLAATAEEAAQIALLARERGLAGGVAFHLRFLPALQEAQRRIAGGALGEVVSFHTHYFRASNLDPARPIGWRFAGSGSGVLQDLGSHLIDLAHFLLGPIASVSARTRTLIAQRPDGSGQLAPVTSDDVAWLQLALVGGGVGTLEASKVVPGAGDDIRFTAYGTRGALAFDTRDPNGLEIMEGNAPERRYLVTASRADPPAAVLNAEKPTGSVQWHLALISAFCAALAGGAPFAPNLEDGAATQRVIAAAFRSAAEGGATMRVG
jgi:predicted dehydrogenase